MKILRLLQTSTRFRLVVTLAAMLLPVIVLAVVSFILFNGFIDSFIEVTDEMVVEIQPNSQIQAMIPKFVSDLDHFVLEPGESRRRTVRHQAKRIDGAFRNHLKVDFSHKNEKGQIISAFREWQKAKKLALKMVNGNQDEIGAPQEAINKTMERIDILLGRSVRTLEKANGLAIGEIREELELARASRRRNIWSMTLAIFFGAVMALGAGVMLTRSILRPLSTLEEGVRRLGSGELDYRIQMEADDELGRVGAAFNIMAGRLEMDQAALADLARHDELTRLLNRRELFRFLAREIERSKRSGEEFSVMMIDIDDFKKVNDVFGHLAGDEVLRVLAQTIRGALRPVDIVARYGGEEFMIILPQSGRLGAHSSGERIRRLVEALEIEIDKETVIGCTISVGLAVFPVDAASDERLIAASDKALYLAKEDGKNLVRDYGEKKGGAA
ncbi:MAG TPA: diguanylate cyclase [Actinobacteria bacterium]|nr:diguanylate cyclase [Actinomycetota bacterium]